MKIVIEIRNRVFFVVFLLFISNSFGDNITTKITDKKVENTTTHNVCTVTEFDDYSEQDVLSGKVIIKTEESDLQYDLDNYSHNGGNSSKGGSKTDDDDECPCGDCGGPDGGGGVRVATSHDPNDILGPAGYGDEKFINGSSKIQYTIQFENDPEFATAPAQEVFIEQIIDNDLNFKSYRVSNFGFGNYIFEVSTTKPFYQTRIDLVDSLGIYLDFLAGTNLEENKLFWILRSIDPETGMTPEDPMKGFLQVNDDTGRGEGFVSYTIYPKDEYIPEEGAEEQAITTGTEIIAQAEIVFDVNAPIKTPEIKHTLDFEKPVSHITNISLSGTSYIVEWEPDYTALGSEVKDYKIYYSKDDKPFEVWIENTTDNNAVFTPAEDGCYKFYSIARSNVNIIEDEKNTTEFEIKVGTQIELKFISESPIEITENEDAEFNYNLSNFSDVISFKNITDPDYPVDIPISNLNWKIADNDFLNYAFFENESVTKIKFSPMLDWNGTDEMTIIASYKDYSASHHYNVILNPVQDDPKIYKEYIDKEINFTEQMDFKPFEIDLLEYFYEPDGDPIFFSFTTNDESNPVASYNLVDSKLNISSLLHTIGSVTITVSASDDPPSGDDLTTTKTKSKNKILNRSTSTDSSIKNTKENPTLQFELKVDLPSDVFYVSENIPDLNRDIDFSPFEIDLNDHFKTVEGNTLVYSVNYDTETIACKISDNILSVTSIPDATGETEITVTATDEAFQMSLTDDFIISIQTINSASPEPLTGQNTIYVAIANYSDEIGNMKLSFESGDGLLFKVLQGEEEISVSEIVTYSYFDYIEQAVQHYFSTMTGGKLNITVKILSPNQASNEVWSLQERNHYEDMPEYQRRSALINDLEQAMINSGNTLISDLINQDKQSNEKVFLNYILPDYDNDIGYIRGNNTETQLETGVSFDKILRKMVQQLCVTTLDIGYKGYDVNESYFDGYIGTQFMGRAGSQTGPYDIMFKSDRLYDISPYSLYGLNQIHSQDLFRQGYIDTDVLTADESNILVSGENSYEVRLTSLRDQSVKTQTKSKTDDKESVQAKLVKVPLNISESESRDNAFPDGTMTDKQYFLIEFKNSTGYDELSPFEQENDSRGILISHVINADGYIENDRASSVVDIEAATPFPVNYRDPSQTNINDQDYNGSFYNGREINDWLDDFNDNDYALEGGISSPDQTEGTCSLPSDFFNMDRNKFTPVTRPSSDSWKNNDTHVGVFIDNIDYSQNYADIRIYRNYWSKPVEEDTRVAGIGYFGENFTVENDAELTIGSDAVPAGNTIFTVLSGSVMTISANSILKLTDNSSLIVEEGGNIVFEPGSQLIIEGNASIKTYDTGLEENCKLVLNDDSKLRILEGCFLNMYSLSSLELHKNSELIIEKDAFFYIWHTTDNYVYENSKLTVEDYGKFHSLGTRLVGGPARYIYVNDEIPSYGIYWYGIYAGVGSEIKINYSEMDNANYIINGSPGSCIINNSVFTNCRHGVNLIYCNNYSIYNNSISGYNLEGSNRNAGLFFSLSEGNILQNTISDFNSGVTITSCSPVFMKNTIMNNNRYGMWLLGNNSYAWLADPFVSDIYASNTLNNVIKNNGINYTGGSQIYLEEPSNIYLTQGLNNIFSDGNTNPCIKTSPVLKTKANDDVTPEPKIEIKAILNYWGAEQVTSSFFDLSSNYKITYMPFLEAPLASPGTVKPYGLAPVASAVLEAMEAEILGNYNDAQTLFKNIIEENPFEEESYVSYSELPDNYLALDEDPIALIEDYDEMLNENGTKIHPKFFKEMKIITNLKSRQYEQAISLAQEMKEQSVTLKDSLLADIDIEVALMMKNAESTKKEKDAVAKNLDKINQILDILSNRKESGVEELLLPSKYALHQNYPNPFNPVTTIKYDLPEESYVKMLIYNTKGEMVTKLIDSQIEAGFHQVIFDASKYSNGVYYYSLLLNGKCIATKKMAIIK